MQSTTESDRVLARSARANTSGLTNPETVYPARPSTHVRDAGHRGREGSLSVRTETGEEIMYVRPPSHAEALGPGSAGPSLALPFPNSLDQLPKHASHRPQDGGAAFCVDPKDMRDGFTGHTQSPMVTGTSVLGLVYKGGVIIASDMLGAYGATKRYKSIQRIYEITSSTIVGASGELSDFQYLQEMLKDLTTDDFCSDDGITLSPQEIYSWLNRVMYNRRNKFDPLWNTLIVAGLKDGKPFLGSIGMLGVGYQDAHIATGFGNHLARPLFREKHNPEMSEQEAVDLIQEGLKVCYYRDKTSINKFQMAKVTKDGVTISEPFSLETEWSFKHFVNPSLNAVGTW